MAHKFEVGQTIKIFDPMRESTTGVVLKVSPTKTTIQHPVLGVVSYTLRKALNDGKGMWLMAGRGMGSGGILPLKDK